VCCHGKFATSLILTFIAVYSALHHKDIFIEENNSLWICCAHDVLKKVSSVSAHLGKSSISQIVLHQMRFEVLTAVNMKMAVLWAIVPCSLVDVYRHFRGAYCLHHQGDDGGSKLL
jgi:hypothetical protein